jgi:hypothetical protein
VVWWLKERHKFKFIIALEEEGLLGEGMGLELSKT